MHQPFTSIAQIFPPVGNEWKKGGKVDAIKILMDDYKLQTFWVNGGYPCLIIPRSSTRKKCGGSIVGGSRRTFSWPMTRAS
jgi:hypothetical protein